MFWTIHIISGFFRQVLETIGVPTSTALSKPMITPEEKVFHPEPHYGKDDHNYKKECKWAAYGKEALELNRIALENIPKEKYLR
jgi:hypothetical protein